MVKYICLGESVRGTSHISQGLLNQDAIKWFPDYPNVAERLPIILAVSDGHGSAKSFRSHKGSEIAVETAIKVIQENVFGLNIEAKSVSKSDITYLIENRLPQKIAYEWRQAVIKDLHKDPIKDAELKNLEQKLGVAARKQVEADADEFKFIVYGATLLCLIVTELFIAYLQLGDGDILCVDAHGETTKPIPKDEKLIANETTSLCLKDAWKEFRCKTDIFYPEVSADKKPALILVSTDGLSNSYSSDKGFRKIGSDYLNIIRSNGIESVAEELETFLNDISEEGSGDDITLGMIVQQPLPLPEEAENDDNSTESNSSIDHSSESDSDSDTGDAQENDSANKNEKKNRTNNFSSTNLSSMAIALILIFGAVSISFGVWSWLRLDRINARLNDLQNSVTDLETTIADLTTESANRSATEESEATAPSAESDRTNSDPTQTPEDKEDNKTEETPSEESDRTSSNQSETTENEEGNKTNESETITPESDRTNSDQSETTENEEGSKTEQ